MRSSSHISKYPGAVNDNNEIFGSMWHSIHPADTIETILKRHQVLINDSRIRMEVDPDYLNYPAKVSDYSPESIPFQVVANSALEVSEDGRIIPGPMGGPNYGMRTDSGRHYWNLTDNIYRFSPIVMTPKDIKMHHGKNEKISITNYNQVCTSNYCLWNLYLMRKI